MLFCIFQKKRNLADAISQCATLLLVRVVKADLKTTKKKKCKLSNNTSQNNLILNFSPSDSLQLSSTAHLRSCMVNADDYRIFVGDLGNECTDDNLAKAFSKYPTFTRAKVIRDKRTQKSKGYGFVSLMDPEDFVKAMREMNGES
jgi:RNA recognition motif-containing protein